eukprot:CAMPEP_0185541416 /NCGR_PEP_ID=MMETSP1381-20130426/1954_1 /TAXON_ID=298111 /ORGANISM="Pavlova sp., Strain CCMP459" /LENGTH=49 /DNA_ID= /DNA_START= /DNA_END= /DNA_ORIENTATION=
MEERKSLMGPARDPPTGSPAPMAQVAVSGITLQTCMSSPCSFTSGAALA